MTPLNGTVPIDESIQVTIDFAPTTSGEHKLPLVLHYETGEDIFINLYGVSIDANVRLDKNSIRVENTYLSMANQRTVTIANRSNVIAHFRWTQYATQEEEDQHRMMLVDPKRPHHSVKAHDFKPLLTFRTTEGLRSEERGEKDRFLEECIQDPSLRDKMSILSRTYKNRQRVRPWKLHLKLIINCRMCLTYNFLVVVLF